MKRERRRFARAGRTAKVETRVQIYAYLLGKMDNRAV
jgi:hypothetical protein